MASTVFLFRPGAIGDTLLLAPALAALRKCYPETRVSLAAHHEAARLLASSGLVDVALSRDDPRLGSLFGPASDLHPLREVLGDLEAAVAWLSDPEGVVAANLRRLGAARTLVMPSQPPPGSGLHCAEHLATAFRQLGLADEHLPPPPLVLPSLAEQGWVEGLLGPRVVGTTRVVAVHPGSGGRRKNWPAGLYARVLEDLAAEAALVLVSGPSDEEQVEAVRAQSKAPVVLARDLPLAGVCALLAHCDAFLGNDSGLTHLAALQGLPVVALFGPTDPRTWKPWGPRARVLTFAEGDAALEVAAVVEAVRAALQD